MAGTAALFGLLILTTGILFPPARAWLARGIALIAGTVLLYVSVFLYEDEEKRIRNRLEAFWIRVDDKARSANSRRLAFAHEFAQLGSRFLNGIFGTPLFSVRSVILSAFLSFTSFLLFVVDARIRMAFLWEDYFPYSPGIEQELVRSAVLWSALLAAHLHVLWRLVQRAGGVNGSELEANSFAPEKLLYPLGLLTFSLFVYLVSWVGDPRGTMEPGEQAQRFTDWTSQIGIILAGGIAGDILVLTFARKLLRSATHLDSWITSLLATIVGAALGLVLFAGPLLAKKYLDPMNLPLDDIPEAHWNEVAAASHQLFLLSFIGMSNVFDAVGSFVLFTLGGVLLLHRLIWRAVPRVTYAPIHHDIIGKKKLLGVAGLTLLVYALPGIRTGIALVAKVFEITF